MLENRNTLKNNFPEYDDWRLLGRGTFSAVYRIREKRTGRLLACKVVASRELAEREKDFLQKASHPLFPRFERYVEFKRFEGTKEFESIKRFEETEATENIEEVEKFEEFGHFKRLEHRQDYFGIFMEYIPGITLKKLIKQRGSLTEKQVTRLGCSLAEGLLFLHEQSLPIIYRDLKPENVLIQQDGRVRLIDLGCACYVEERKRTRAGTRDYAAPEQWEENGQAGVESDVYALGKLLQFTIGLGSESKRKYQHAFWELLEDMTRQERKRRVPDMRIFLQRMDHLVPSEKRQGAKNAKSTRVLFQKQKKRASKQRRKWIAKKTWSRKKIRNMQFYYQKNIHRGT